MKKIVCLSLWLLTAFVAVAQDRPWVSQIDAVVADPSVIGILLAACDTDAEAVEAVVVVIQSIGDAAWTLVERQRRIALVVARVVVRFDAKSPEIVGAIAARLDDLGQVAVVTAAAVYAAGGRSPQVMDAILEAAAKTPDLREIIEHAARNPVAILGTTTMAQLAIIADLIAPPPSPSPAPVHVGDVPLETHERPVGLHVAPVPPPRPPAPRYRGQ